MDAETILKLVNAGFTKEDIMGLGNVQAQTPTVETPAPTPEPAPVQVLEVAEEPVAVATPAPAPAPAPTPAPAQEQPSLSDVMHQMAKLTASIQANALANTNIPNGADPRGGLTGENALAEIIRPTFGGGKNV